MVTSRKVPVHDNIVGKTPGGNDVRTERIYKRLQATDAPPLEEPLRGYIFVCNQETMDEDLRLQLFGLPLRYLESVKCIQPGMPLFLYNYTTHKLHGVYEATSVGGQNLDPDAWENKEFTRNSNGGVVSRFPAQVRIKVRDERSPLDEGVFRKVLFHYEGSKFRLELGRLEVEQLFMLFNVSGGKPRENVQVKKEDDDGGEWEKVTGKGKSKGFGRSQGGIAWKAPNPSSKKLASGVDDRRRGFGVHVNGSSAGLPSSSYDHSTGGDLGGVGRSRDRDAGGDSGGRWRNDDAWGSSSAGAGSSGSLGAEEERTVKQRHENGDVRSHDMDRLESNGSRAKHGRHLANGSGDGEALSERSSDRSSDAAGSPKATLAGGAWPATRAGPISYSAILKAGLDGAVEPVTPASVGSKVRQAASADSSAPSTSSATGSVRNLTASAQNGGQHDRVEGDLNGTSSEGRADTMSTTGSLQSRGSSLAGDDKPCEVSHQRGVENGVAGGDLAVKAFEKPLGAWGKRPLAVVSAARPGEGSKTGNGPWSSVASGTASGLSEVKGKDVDGRRGVSMDACDVEADGQQKEDGVCEVSTRGLEDAKGTGPNVGDVKSPVAGEAPKVGAGVKQVGGGSAPTKNGAEAKAAPAKNGVEAASAEARHVDGNAATNAKPLDTETRGTEMKPVAGPPLKKAWQGNEAAVLRRLADPDPASTTTRTTAPVPKLQQDIVQAGRQPEVQGSSPLRVDESARPVSSSDSRQSRGASSSSIERRDLAITPTSKVDTSSAARVDTAAQSRPPPETAAPPVSSQPQRSPSSQLPTQYHRRQQQIPQEFHQRQGQSGDRLKHAPSERQQHVHQHRRQQSMQMQQSRQEQLPLPLLPPPLQQGQVMLAPLRVNTPPQVQSPSFSGPHHQLFSPVGPLPSPQQRQGIRGGRGGGNRNMGLEVPGMVYMRGDGPMAMQSGHLPPAWGIQSPVMMQTMMSPIGGNPNFTLPPPNLLASLNLPALHEEILEFALHARPSAAARARAEAAVECVRNAVQHLWPGSDVEIFGSFATGLCLPHSDVDCVVVGAPNPSSNGHDTVVPAGGRALAPLIRELAAALKDQPWCESISPIETASMPVVKLRCRPPPEDDGENAEEAQELQQGVAIDITIGGSRQNHESEGPSGVDHKDAGPGIRDWKTRVEAAKSAHNGAAAREFVIERLKQMPALAPLVLLMKSYLHHRGLKDVYSGGLGSFSLTLMLVFYLERVPIDTGKLSSSSLQREVVGVEPVMKPEEPQAVCKNDSVPSDGIEHSTKLPAAGPLMAASVPPADQPTSLLSPSGSSKEVTSAQGGPALATIAAGRLPNAKEIILESVDANVKVGPEAVPSTVHESGTSSADQRDLGMTSERPGGVAEGQADSSSSCTGASETGGSTCASVGNESQATASSDGVHEGRAGPIGGEGTGLSRRARQGKKVGIAEEIVESMLTVPSPNLAILLAGFLHIFGEALDTSMVKLVLKSDKAEGGVFLQDSKRTQRVVLWIDDPLRPGSNIGGGSFAMFYVQQAMREMLAGMRGTGSLAKNELKAHNQRRNLPLLDSLFSLPQQSRAFGQFTPPS